jgi:hypothetical protein
MVVSVNAASGVIALPAEDYLIVRDGSAFRAWFARQLKLGELVFAEQTIGDGGRCTIRLVTRPDLAAWVPASVRKHVTSAAEIEFVDELTYERSALEAPPYRIHVRTSSPFLGERLRIEATMTIAPVDEWHCTHSYQGTISCRMFGFGSLVERMVRDSIASTYRKLGDVINSSWLEEEKRAKAAFGPGVLTEGRPIAINCGVGWIEECIERGMVRGEKPARTAEISDACRPARPDRQASVETSPNRTPPALHAAAYRLWIVWIVWIDLVKVLFIVVVVLLLRLRFVRLTPSLANSSTGKHRRKASWDAFVGPSPAVQRTVHDADDLLRRAHHRRRRSAG